MLFHGEGLISPPEEPRAMKSSVGGGARCLAPGIRDLRVMHIKPTEHSFV